MFEGAINQKCFLITNSYELILILTAIRCCFWIWKFIAIHPWKSELWIQRAGKMNWGVFADTDKLTHCQLIATVCTTSQLLPSALIHNTRNEITIILAWSCNFGCKMYCDRNQFTRSRNSDVILDIHSAFSWKMVNRGVKPWVIYKRIWTFDYHLFSLHKQIWIIKTKLMAWISHVQVKDFKRKKKRSHNRFGTLMQQCIKTTWTLRDPTKTS